MKLLVVALIVYLFNIPFGYWRQNVKKFSLQWVLAIHSPIPFIVLLRIYSGIGFQFITYPVLISSFFLGQLTGSYISKVYLKKYSIVSSCLVMDFVRAISK